MPDQARIGHDLVDARRREARDAREVEAGEGLTVTFALAQHRVPAQSGLRAFERDVLEQHVVVVYRDAPFVVVIVLLERRRGRPWAAYELFLLRHPPAPGIPRRSSAAPPRRDFDRGARSMRCRGSAASPASARAATPTQSARRRAVLVRQSVERLRFDPRRTANRCPGQKHDAVARARVQHVVGRAVFEVIAVLHGDDGHDRACFRELLESTLDNADVADLPRAAAARRSRRSTRRTALSDRAGEAGRGRCTPGAGAASCLQRRAQVRRPAVGRPSRPDPAA